MATTIEKSDKANGAAVVPATHNWDPFGEIEGLIRGLGTRRFGWPTNWNPFDGVDFTPAADIEETDTAWKIEVELPGVNKEDVEVETHGRTVVIKGERKEKVRDGVLRQRRRVTGSFRYEVSLPGDFDVDGIKAALDAGELTVTVPKAEAEQPRKIVIA